MTTLPEQWRDECVEVLEIGPGSPLVDTRSSYLLWLVGRRLPHPSSVRDDGKKLLRALGYRTRRVDKVTVWANLAIHMPGSSWKHPAPPATNSEVLQSIKTLRNAGLISAETAQQAWRELENTA